MRTVMARSVIVSLFMGSLFANQNTCGQVFVATVDFGSYVKVGQTFSSDCYSETNTTNPYTGGWTMTPDVGKAQSKECTDCMESVFNRFSLLFFAILFMMMGNLQAISGLCRERLQFYRETAAGCYSTWPSFAGSTLVYLPLMLVSTLFFGVVIYFFVGFLRTVDAFMYFFAVMFACNFIGYSTAQLLAAVSPTPDVALALFPVSFIFFNTFAGFLIHIPEVPTYWIWATDISFVRWAIQGVVINEIGPQPQLRYYNGHDALGAYGFADYDKMTSIYILIIICIVIRALTLIFLSYVRHGST